MKVGQIYKLTVKGPHGAVKWRSSKSSVAAVDNSGVVRAKKKGTANIYAQVGKKKLKCRITVKNPAPSINKKSLTLYRGGTFRLAVKYPTSKVKWSSSNKKVATINSKGIVIAKKNGKTTITAAMRGRKLKCSVVVKSAPAPSSNRVVNITSNPITNTPAGGNGSTGTKNGGTTTPAQPSTEHTHAWKLDGDIPITYYCGEPLRYVCTSCGQMFKNFNDIDNHIGGFLVSNANVTDVEIYYGPAQQGNYSPDTKPQYGTPQFMAMGGPVHHYVQRNGQLIYGLPVTQLKSGAFTGTEFGGPWTPSSEAYQVFWNGSSAKTMVVCSCGAIFANQECLDRHINVINDLNKKLAANTGKTPYLHSKKGTGVECGICRVTHGRYYTCATCGAYKFQPDNDYPKSAYPQ